MAGGVLLLGAPAVYADNITSGEEGTGSGNQTIVQTNTPILTCANGAVGSEVGCEQEVESGGDGDNITSGEEGAESGNQEITETNTPTLTCGEEVIGATPTCEQEVVTR